MALEPASETVNVEDVVAGKLLAARDHLLATNGAEIGFLKFFFGGVWTSVLCLGGKERERENKNQAGAIIHCKPSNSGTINNNVLNVILKKRK